MAATKQIDIASLTPETVLDAVARRETLVLRQNGRQIAELTPMADADIGTGPALPKLGFMRGQGFISDEFDRAYADEIADLFEGRTEDQDRR